MPTERLYSYFYHYKLDVDKMKEATSYLIDAMILQLLRIRRTGEDHHPYRDLHGRVERW